MQHAEGVSHLIGEHLEDLSGELSLLSDPGVSKNRFLLPGGTPIEKGALAAQRVTIAGLKDGEPIIRFRVNWYTTTEIDQDWELRPNGWRMLVEGPTPIDMSITFPMSVSDPQFSPAMAGREARRPRDTIPPRNIAKLRLRHRPPRTETY